MDWLTRFAEDFGKHDDLKTLKQKRFHGNLTLNFSDGVVMNCEQKERFNAIGSNLTKGG